MKKTMYKLVSGMLVGMLALAPSVVFAGNNVFTSSKELKVGDKFELKVYASSDDIDDDDFIWSSSNEQVVALADDQNTGDDMDFKAVGVGQATITCRIAGTDVEQTCVVTVKANTNKVYQLKAMRSPMLYVKDQDDFDVEVGKKEKITAYILNGNKKDKNLTYKSLTPKICSVDKNGKVTGKKVGTGKIEITSKNDSFVRTVLTVRVEKD